MPVTRQNDIGLAGKAPGSADSAQRSAGSVADPYLRQYVINIPAQTVAAAYGTGFTMPANAVAASGYLKAAAQLVGTAPTISVGVAGAAAGILAAVNPAVGVNPTLQGANISGEEITYTIGGTVTTGRDFELVLTVLCSDS